MNACQGAEISKYHLEAGIAYWHTTPAGQNKWHHILKLYDQLITIESSPATVLNRLFALAKVHGSQRAIMEAGKLTFERNCSYYELLGYLYGDENAEKAIHHYKKALSLIKSDTQKATLVKEITRLTQMVR